MASTRKSRREGRALEGMSDDIDVNDAEAVEEADEEEAPVKKGRVAKGELFTYVGAGADSPRVIEFMGTQRFVRGEAAEVTDPEILAKVKGNPTFVVGEASQEQLHQIDEEGELAEKEQQAKDKIAEAEFRRKQAKGKV